MIKTKNNGLRIASITISLLMFFIFLINENIIPHVFSLVLFALLTGLSFYFVPYRLIKNPEMTISKGIDLGSNLIMGATCAYMIILLYSNNSNIITAGQVLVIISTLFSYYVWYVSKEHTLTVFVSHFIVAFFLMGLLKFVS